MFWSEVGFCCGWIGQRTRWLDRIMGEPSGISRIMRNWIWMSDVCFEIVIGMVRSLSRYLKYVSFNLLKRDGRIHENLSTICSTSKSWCFFSRTWTLSGWMRTNISWFMIPCYTQSISTFTVNPEVQWDRNSAKNHQNTHLPQLDARYHPMITLKRVLYMKKNIFQHGLDVFVGKSSVFSCVLFVY